MRHCPALTTIRSHCPTAAHARALAASERTFPPHAQVSLFRTLFDFFRIPLVKRANAMMFNFCFLVLQVIVFFRPLCLPATVLDYVFAIWVVAIILEELEQMISDVWLYRQNMWNVVDCIRAVLGILVVVMRYMLAFGSRDGDGARDAVEWWSHETGGWAHQGSWMVFDDSRVSTLDTEHVCEWSWKMEAVRTFAACLILVSTFRMMEVLTFHKDVGVLLVCVWEMISDLYNWAKPAMIITTGFGLVMHMLAPEYRLDGSPGAWRPFRIGWLNLDLDISSAGPFWMTAWGLLGFFEPGELSAAPGSAFLAPVFLWFYLLIQLVLFVNLLIAMFSRSYAKIMAQADENWKMKRVVQVKSYITAHECPPPFNIVTLPPTLLYRSLCNARKKAGTKKVKAPAAVSRGSWARINGWRGRRVAPEGRGMPSLAGGGRGPGGDKSTCETYTRCLGPPPTLKKSATSLAAEMKDGAKDIFAAWTFTAAKAQAIEERARRAFLDGEEKQEEKQGEVPRKLDQLEKLILEATEATKKSEKKQEHFHSKLDKLSQLVVGLAGSSRVAPGASIAGADAPRLLLPLPRQAPRLPLPHPFRTPPAPLPHPSRR